MISANIPNYIRKEVYRRDGYRCALCDCDVGLQIHHAVPRGQGGTSYPHNLITLCWRCHAVAHGTRMPEYGDMDADQMTQACIEYLADRYAEDGLLWNPWAERLERILGGRE